MTRFTLQRAGEGTRTPNLLFFCRRSLAVWSGSGWLAFAQGKARFGVDHLRYAHAPRRFLLWGSGLFVLHVRRACV
jgi:hypothetical protein